MRTKFLIYLLCLSLVACNQQVRKEYEVPMLNKYIKEFISSKRCFDKPIEILVVTAEKRNNDTLAVEIADCYPSVDEFEFGCDTVMYGYRVVFTGDKLKGYCQNELEGNAFPKDILEINREKTRLFEEASSWLFLYKNSRLVYKDLGCAEDKP